MSEEAGTANGRGGCFLWVLLFALVFGIIDLFEDPERGIKKMLMGVAFCCLYFLLMYLIEKSEKAIGASATKTTEKNDVPVGSNSSKRRIESEQISPPPKPVFAAKPPRIRKPASSAQPRSVPARRVCLKNERTRLKDL